MDRYPVQSSQIFSPWPNDKDATMKIIPKHVWHVWFTERLYSNGWAPNLPL